MNVLIGTTEISGIAGGIQSALLLSGVHATTVFRFSHPYQYSNESCNSWVVTFWQWLGGKLLTLKKRSWVCTLLLRFLCFGWSFVVLFWSVFKFDTYLFLFGTSISNTTAELILLRFLRKKVVFFYVGSDSRPTYIDGGIASPWGGGRGTFLYRDSLVKKRKVEVCEKYSDFCIASPYSAHFHTKKVSRCFSLGIPKELGSFVSSVPPSSKSKTIRALHAPSHSGAKGTHIIEAAIAELKKAGHRIELIKLEGVSNAVVLEELRKCDFVVDQVYSDTPMAALATEAAAMGKPSVVGGFGALNIHRYISSEDIPPTLYVLPENIRDAIHKMATDERYRINLGLQARQFVETRWSPEEIGRRYVRMFKGDIPETWWYDPADVDYVFGYGLSSADVKRSVSAVVDEFGVGGLFLSGKPRLEEKYLELVRS